MFFFSSRRRHTRCSRDWSSDVCSSDLEGSVKPTPRLVTMPLIYTDGEGRFSAYLPPGLYDVLVSHAVMEPVAKKIKIEPGKLATFECQVQLSILAETVKN